MTRSIRRIVFTASLAAAAFSVNGFLSPTLPARADDATTKEALPAAKDVIEKYITATGGRERFAKITTRRSTGAFEVPGAMKGTMSIVQAAPDLTLVTIDIPEVGKILKGSNGGTYWESTPMTGVRLLDPPEQEEMQRQFLFESDLNWDKYYESAETVGVESVDGRPTYKIKMVAASDGKISHFYYDKETGLLVKSDSQTLIQGNSIPVTTHVSSYQDFDGVKVATTVKMEVAGMEQRITIATDEHNPVIDPKTFDLPDDVKAFKAKLTPAPGK